MGSHLRCGYGGDPGHWVHGDKPPGTWASRAARHAMHHGTPARHVARRERPRRWVRPRRWAPLAPGEGAWGCGGGRRWLSPKQDVPLGAGDALRQPFAECPRLLHRPREEEEGCAGERRAKGGTRAPAPARRQGGHRDGDRMGHGFGVAVRWWQPVTPARTPGWGCPRARQASKVKV